MSDYILADDNTGIKIPKFIDIELPSGNTVKVKNGTDWKTLNKMILILITTYSHQLI